MKKAKRKKPHKGTENLIPLNKRTKEEQRKIQRKGGLVRCQNRKVAARLRELKKKGLTDETAQKFADIMTDASISSLEGLTWIQRWMGKANTVSEGAVIGRLLNDGHKAHHGDKKIVQSTNLNVEVKMAPEEAQVILEGLRVKSSGKGKV